MHSVGVSGGLCVLMDEIGCFELLMLCGYTLLVLMTSCRPASLVYFVDVLRLGHWSCSYLLFFFSKF